MPPSPPGSAPGWTPAGGGGIWWRRGDNFKNAPANGPAAILAARTGDLEFAARITDWIAATLIDPQTGLVRDGVRLNPDGTIRNLEATTYTYCQGVYLGACVELAERDGHPRWAHRAARVLSAVATIAGPDKVIPGFDDGGDGGLFNGILARYLADTAVRRPELTALAAPLVLASADAAWQGRAELDDTDLDHPTGGGPVFAPGRSRSSPLSFARNWMTATIALAFCDCSATSRAAPLSRSSIGSVTMLSTACVDCCFAISAAIAGTPSRRVPDFGE